MHTIDLLYQAAKPDYQSWTESKGLTPAPGICCVTGEYREATVSRRLALPKTYTDGVELWAPGSERISVAAADVLHYKWERMGSWVCDGAAFRRLIAPPDTPAGFRREPARRAVLDDSPAAPWAGFLTTTYKKHGSIKAPINLDGQRRWLFDDLVVDCSDVAQMREWYNRMAEMRYVGVSRAALEHLEIDGGLLAKIGWQRWYEYADWAGARMYQPLYALLLYLMPSQQEVKNDKSE